MWCICTCCGLFRERERYAEKNDTIDKSIYGGSIKQSKQVVMTEHKPLSWKDCEPWSPPITQGQVIKVYDGDTITIASKLPYAESPMYRWSVRLLGIDTPEMKSHDPKLKNLATHARDVLSDKILNKTVHLENVSTEKFGRILANVIFQGENMNQFMIDNKFAYEYTGARKLTELEQIELLEIK
tara:strand:+ start:685 stop:1236 length:552 start_codon:yes stop_codon:yes gene_type:complete